MCLANGRSDGGGTATTWVHMLLLAVGDVLRPREPAAVLGDQQSASSEGEDDGQADSSSSSAAGSEDRASGQEVTDRKTPQHGFPLRLGVLNVRDGARKRAKVEATMRRQRLDVLGVTQTHSRRQGWQFAPSYTALESGAVDVEGKAVLVPEEAEFTLRPEGATGTEFVVVVQSRGGGSLAAGAGVCPAGSGGPRGIPPVDRHRHVFRRAGGCHGGL